MEKIKFIMHYAKGYKRHVLVMIIATMFYVSVVLINPLVLQYFIDNVIYGKSISDAVSLFIHNILGGTENIKNTLLGIGIIIIILNALSGVSLFFRGYSNGIFSESMNQNLRNHLYDHLQTVPYAYHVQSKTGDLIQRCISDVDTVSRFLNNQLKELIYAFFMVVISLTIMFQINVKMTLITMAVFPVIFFFGFVFFKKMQKIFKEVDEAEAELSNGFKESIDAVRVVKAFNRERYELEKFEKQNRSFKQKVEHMIWLLGVYWGISDTICFIQIMIVLVVSVFEVNAGAMSVGNAIVFVSYISTVLWPIRNVGRILSDMGKLTVAIDRLKEITDVELEPLDEGDTPNIYGDIKFENVGFQYHDANTAILDSISFEIKKGETIAIMGPTGSGKSSLVHLLTRLYDPTSGKIYIDGYDITQISRRHLRKNVGIVLQEPFLFSKTVYDNIKVAAPHASQNDVYEAANTASIHDVISSFDKGYDTAVGEKGVTLSGGQKQRVAIARTILDRRPIVIFDDSLSALDSETDASIRKALKSKSKGTTTILITHRINSAMQADRIIMIDKGRVVQIGSHDRLINEEGIYQKIARIQQKGGDKDVS